MTKADAHARRLRLNLHKPYADTIQITHQNSRSANFHQGLTMASRKEPICPEASLFMTAGAGLK
jgi:hypothetical protein